ncbi:acyl carrier protein [Bacillus cereus]
MEVEELNENSNLYEAGLSSHSSVNVMLALETEFDIEFSDELLSKKMFASITNLKRSCSSSPELIKGEILK